MKKIILSIILLASCLGSIGISGQMEMSKYDYVTNGETNMYQGIPNISFPLLSLSVPAAGINIGVSLSYTTESASAYNLISDIGKGWNLSPIGSVVRSKTRAFEDFTLPAGTNNNEATSDVYYYNYPGGSGRFYIGMDTVSHELTGVHITPSNDKIIVTKNNTKPNRVQSFTIIDTKGNRYLFDKININKFHIWGPFDADRIESVQNTKFINSGFFLSKIYNVKNEEIVNIDYLTTTQIISGNNVVPGTLQNQKIKRITVNGMGSIEYQYTDDYPSDPLSYQTNQDRYTMNKLVLKNTQNQIINQYAFDHEGAYLKKLINLDKNNAPVQKFGFEYNNELTIGGYNTYIDNYGYPIIYEFCEIDKGELITPYHTNRNTASYGTLQRIILPTGGITEYEFESHSIPFDPNTTCTDPKCYYDNYDFDKIYTVNFDTNLNSQYTVNLPVGYQNDLFVKYKYTLHPNQPGHPGTVYTIDYTVNNDSGSPFMHSYEEIECPEIKAFKVNPGPLSIKFSGVKKGYGTVEIYAPKIQRRDKNAYGYGLRLKSMKNFNPGSAIPVSYTNYEYSTFTDPLLSSGTALDFGDEIDFTDTRKETPPIGYSNIKVSNMIDGSYSKYYYTPRTEIPVNPNSVLTGGDRDMSAYLVTSGVLQKKEDYSPSGQLLQKSEITPTFKQVPLANITTGQNPVQKISISKQVSTTETYVNGMAKKLVSASESNFDDTYSNLISSKETLADGTVVEKTLLYPQDKGIQKLLAANMVDVPLETTTMKNGKMVGKAETKFDDPAHLYPTSVISYNMQSQAPVTASTLDVYDSKGNLVQVTGKNGVSVTTIWGYYQTQPIAVITGASYAQVSSLATVTAAIAASNADHDDPSQEPQLLTALENLRKDPALQNYTVTCTTYDPMIGVTNSISANGIRTVNIYNTANKLVKVTDAAGKTLQEYQYHYKN